MKHFYVDDDGNDYDGDDCDDDEDDDDDKDADHHHMHHYSNHYNHHLLFQIATDRDTQPTDRKTEVMVVTNLHVGLHALDHEDGGDVFGLIPSKNTMLMITAHFVHLIMRIMVMLL